ncbi:MAG: hypothetical protein ACKVZJ_07455 [Phycisphaerales bacterium]
MNFAHSATMLSAETPRAVLFTSEPTPSSSAGSAGTDLAGAAASAVAGSPWLIAGWCVIGALVVVASVLISRVAWRGRWREPPINRATTHLARELGLDEPSLAMLNRLAKTLGAEPAALLLSESAFERAADVLESNGRAEDKSPFGRVTRTRDALAAPDKAALLALRAKVFGGNAATGSPLPHARLVVSIEQPTRKNRAAA